MSTPKPNNTTQAGVAREFVNRVQKLRKKAGLQAIDPVEVFYELASPNGACLQREWWISE